MKIYIEDKSYSGRNDYKRIRYYSKYIKRVYFLQYFYKQTCDSYAGIHDRLSNTANRKGSKTRSAAFTEVLHSLIRSPIREIRADSSI